MTTLKTKYMGLELKNPIIVGSSGLTRTVEKMKACESAGAGAVVVKSLFEEALTRDDWGIKSTLGSHPEVSEYLLSEIELQYGAEDYCNLIRDAKEKVDIPVIASINCLSSKRWQDFVSKIELAGADAIELNIFSAAFHPQIDSVRIEKVYFDILKKVKSVVQIPVALKVGNYFTSLPNFAEQLNYKDLDSLVLFNRFTEPDIDINKLTLKTTFSTHSDNNMNQILRWIAVISGFTKYDLSATTGINSAADIIKMILAGAKTVQPVSVFYRNGIDKIEPMLTELQEWMSKHQFESLEQFRGKLNFEKIAQPELWLRAQFMEKIRELE